MLAELIDSLWLTARGSSMCARPTRPGCEHWGRLGLATGHAVRNQQVLAQRSPWALPVLSRQDFPETTEIKENWHIPYGRLERELQGEAGTK